LQIADPTVACLELHDGELCSVRVGIIAHECELASSRGEHVLIADLSRRAGVPRTRLSNARASAREQGLVGQGGSPIVDEPPRVATTAYALTMQAGRWSNFLDATEDDDYFVETPHQTLVSAEITWN
jgi:hypothetical protein